MTHSNHVFTVEKDYLNISDLKISEDNHSYFNYYEGVFVLSSGAKECAYAALVLQWLNSVLMISLNIAVIVTIVRYKKKSRLYFLLMNMAIADLTTGVLAALVNAIERSIGIPYFNFYWFGEDIMCKIYKAVGQASMLASNFILAATSLDRAMVIAKPMMNFKRGFILQKFLIGFCWLLSLLTASPLLFKAHVMMFHPPHMSNDTWIPLCDSGIAPHEWKGFILILFVTAGLIPLVVILTSYIILIYAIYKRANSPPNRIKGRDNLRVSLVFNKGLPSTKVRSIKLTLGIVLSFIAAWAPFFVFMFMHVFGDFNNPYVMPFVTTYYWNAIANPIVFFVFHRQRGSTTSSRRGTYSTSENTLLSTGNSIRNMSLLGK